MVQDPDFDVISSFFPCEIDDAIKYINLGYGAQAPKLVIYSVFFRHFVFFLSLSRFCNFSLISLSYFQGLFRF